MPFNWRASRDGDRQERRSLHNSINTATIKRRELSTGGHSLFRPNTVAVYMTRNAKMVQLVAFLLFGCALACCDSSSANPLAPTTDASWIIAYSPSMPSALSGQD